MAIHGSILHLLKQTQTSIALVLCFLVYLSIFAIFLLQTFKSYRKQSLVHLGSHSVFILCIGLAANYYANSRQAGLIGNKTGLERNAIILNLSQVFQSRNLASVQAPDSGTIKKLWD